MKVVGGLVPFLIAATGLAAAPPASPPNPSDLSQLFYSRIEGRDAPIWVPVERIRTADQKIDRSSFSQEESAALDRKLANQERLKATEHPKGLSNAQKLGHEALREENCVVYETSFYHLSGGPREAGLQGLTGSAHEIYVASVAGVTQGFFLGNPASLLRLEVTETLKGRRLVPAPSEVLAVYPFARFAIGENTFCAGLPGSMPRPEVGQRVVAFLTSDPLDRQGVMSFLGPDQLITREKDGKLSLPRTLRADRELFPVKSLEETVELVRRALEHAPQTSRSVPNAGGR